MKEFVKDVFTACLATHDKVLLHAKANEQLVISGRGLSEDEQKQGILLLFSKTSYKEMKMSSDYIEAKMMFGGSWRTVVIPYCCISSIFDDAEEPAFIFTFNVGESHDDKIAGTKKSDKLITVDFKKNRK